LILSSRLSIGSEAPHWSSTVTGAFCSSTPIVCCPVRCTSFEMFIAESVPRADIDRIVEELRQVR